MRHFLLIVVAAVPPLAYAQAPLPGVYEAGQCGPAPFPVVLPPLDSVVDTTSLRALLAARGVNKRVVVTLRLGALETTSRVWVVETDAPDSVAAQAVADVDAALQTIPPDRAWAFRLRIDGDGGSVLRLERSNLCGAAPPHRETASRGRLEIASIQEVERSTRESEAEQSRLRVLRHRVLVDAAGRVLAVQVAVTSGDAGIDASHSYALQRQVFKPSRLDDRPVTAWVMVRGDRVPQ
jgi:hypothetical protein